MNSDESRTVVIGGGVIGAMCAWYLAKSGRQVVVIDRERFGAACSHGNCGYVSPSHILPLTQPGMIRRALASMFSSRSPFYVRPRWSPELWHWFYRFAQRCNERDMYEAARTIHELLQSARKLYCELIDGERLDCEWQPIGLLLVFRDEREFDHFESTNRQLAERFGVPARPLDACELSQFEPALIEGLGGAWYYDCDCHLRPDKLMSEMRRKLLDVGVEILENRPVTGFRRESGRAIAAQTPEGDVRGETFVVACGALTPFLNDELECNIPIQPGKGYSITMPRPSICPKYPMIFEQHRVAITPMKSAYRIGSTMEFAGYDRSINQTRLKLLKDAARLYLREPYADPIQETWFGWRPMTWDSKPYIDRTPRYENIYVAAGHNMLGLSLATVTGKLISEMINGERPHLDIRPLRLGRSP